MSIFDGFEQEGDGGEVAADIFSPQRTLYFGDIHPDVNACEVENVYQMCERCSSQLQRRLVER